MNNLKSLISPEEIAQKVREIADLLNEEYHGKELLIVLVLKGAICLGADLIRLLKMPIVLETVRAASYGMAGIKPGELSLAGLEKFSVEGRDVLLVDDIYDTGATLEKIAADLRAKHPRSLKTLTLLTRKGAAKRPDYALFEIGDYFVVGYGLDYKEQYRGLPGVYIIL